MRHLRRYELVTEGNLPRSARRVGSCDLRNLRRRQRRGAWCLVAPNLLCATRTQERNRQDVGPF